MDLIIASLIGALAGVIAALCGVGGGIVMVPAFVYFLKLDHKVAVATSLAAIVATAVAATNNNARNGFIDWKFALAAAIGGAVVAHFASDWLRRLSTHSLQILFAVILILMGAQMLWKAFKAT